MLRLDALKEMWNDLLILRLGAVLLRDVCFGEKFAAIFSGNSGAIYGELTVGCMQKVVNVLKVDVCAIVLYNS